MQERTIEPIAIIHTPFHDKFGIPRQSGRVADVPAQIVFLPKFRDPDALREIEQFSHLWLIFDFSESHQDKFVPTVRPPRLGGNKRVGVFASRSPFRPNSLGLSSVKLCGIKHDEVDGDILLVSGADLLDGTPIYDIKPYLPFCDCHGDALNGYAEIGVNHQLQVVINEAITNSIPSSVYQILVKLLADDPRPSYQDDAEREYKMQYDIYNITFTVNGDVLTVKSIERGLS